MSNSPSKLFSLYFTALLLFLSLPGFCNQDSLNNLQKQARDYRQQGLKLQKEGDVSGALTFYQKALLIDSNYIVLYNDIGIVLEAEGEIEQAKDMYFKAIEIAPNYPNSYANLALLYEGQKDYTNAVVFWMKRATLGGKEDAWAEVARKRLEYIARLDPKAFSLVGQEYGKSLKDADIATQPDEPLDEDAAGGKEIDRGRALEYLARAEEIFAKGDYMAALNEANIAQYLDPSNKKISVFIEKVRKQIIH
jgi:tetratricopeptide (TPR) repeat protein